MFSTFVSFIIACEIITYNYFVMFGWNFRLSNSFTSPYLSYFPILNISLPADERTQRAHDATKWQCVRRESSYWDGGLWRHCHVSPNQREVLARSGSESLRHVVPTVAFKDCESGKSCSIVSRTDTIPRKKKRTTRKVGNGKLFTV